MAALIGLDDTECSKIINNEPTFMNFFNPANENNYVLLDAMGTKIKAPLQILNASATIKTWYESDRKFEEAFPLPYSPIIVYEMLDKVCKMPNIYEYLLIDDKYKKYNQNDKCKLVWYSYDDRHYLKISYLLESENEIMHFYVLLCSKFEFMINGRLTAAVIYQKLKCIKHYINKQYYIIYCNYTFSNEHVFVEKKLKITADDIIEAINYYCKKNDQAFEEYVENNKMCIVNKVKQDDPLYIGTVIIHKNGLQTKQILQYIMNKYYENICYTLNIKPRTLRKMIDILSF
jgi:hypothetical protein